VDSSASAPTSASASNNNGSSSVCNNNNNVEYCTTIRGGDINHYPPAYTHNHPNDSPVQSSLPNAHYTTQQPPPPPPPPIEEEKVPIRFIRATKGNIDEANERWKNTCLWRQENGINTILSESQQYLPLIKQHYPHYYHLRGFNNEPCYYEKPAQIDLQTLRQNGVTLPILVRHYALVCEYMWTVIEPPKGKDEAQSIYIIDLEGIRIRDFVGDVVEFVRTASSFTEAHYPERSGSIFVLNVPSWFHVIWNVVKRMVDETTQQKITIMKRSTPKEQITQALMKKIPLHNIPPEYGGYSMPLGQAPEDLQFVRHFTAL